MLPFPRPQNFRPIFAAIAAVLSLSGCGEQPTNEIRGDCALPAFLSTPAGMQISENEMIDRGPGEYRATNVDYFFQSQDPVTYHLYFARLRSELVRPVLPGSSVPIAVQCEDGYSETTAEIQVPVAYSIDRSTGQISSGRIEHFLMYGPKFTRRPSASFDGKTLNRLVNEMALGSLLVSAETKLYRQSATRVQMVTKFEKAFVGETLYVAVTYDLGL